jgi:ATP-dependent phosphoenolpyruvate carboxykinase
MDDAALEDTHVQRKYKIELNITLADGGRSARDVIELYGNQVRDDIDQTAWNLCDCNDQVQSEKFADLALVRWAVTQKRGEDFHVKAQFTVNAQDEEFINQVMEQFMDGFADHIASTENGYYSRTGKRPAMNANPLEWEVDVK